MAAEFSKTVSLRGAHRIDEAFLQRLGAVVSEYVKKPCDFIFTFVDNSDMRSPKFEYITIDTAFMSSTVKKISLRASSYEAPSRSVSITMEDVCRIDASGVRGDVTVFLSDVQNLFSSIETGYSFLNKIWGMRLRVMLSCAAGVGSSYYIMERYPSIKFDIVTGSMMLCFISFLIFGGIEDMKEYFFPKVNFKVAANSAIIARRQAIFRNIFWGIVVAGALGIAVNIVTK